MKGKAAGRGALIRRVAPASPKGSSGTYCCPVPFDRSISHSFVPSRGLPSPGGRWQTPSPARRLTDEGLPRRSGRSCSNVLTATFCRHRRQRPLCGRPSSGASRQLPPREAKVRVAVLSVYPLRFSILRPVARSTFPWGKVADAVPPQGG